MGSDESRLNVSLTVSDKVTRQCPQTTNFEEKGEPNSNGSATVCVYYIYMICYMVPHGVTWCYMVPHGVPRRP